MLQHQRHYSCDLITLPRHPPFRLDLVDLVIQRWPARTWPATCTSWRITGRPLRWTFHLISGTGKNNLWFLTVLEANIFTGCTTLHHVALIPKRSSVKVWHGHPSTKKALPQQQHTQQESHWNIPEGILFLTLGWYDHSPHMEKQWKTYGKTMRLQTSHGPWDL